MRAPRFRPSFDRLDSRMVLSDVSAVPPVNLLLEGDLINDINWNLPGCPPNLTNYGPDAPMNVEALLVSLPS